MIVLGQLPHCSELVLDITLKLRKQAFAAARPAPLQSLLDCAGMSDRHLTRIGRLTAVCAENSDSNVLVMQPTDHGMRHDASDPLNRAGDWRIFVQ